MNSSWPNLLALQRLDFSQAALVAWSAAQGKSTVVCGDSHAHHVLSITRRRSGGFIPPLRVVESVIPWSECLCPARECACPRLLRSIASEEITICSVLLIMGRCQGVKLNGQFPCSATPHGRCSRNISAKGRTPVAAIPGKAIVELRCCSPHKITSILMPKRVGV